MEFVPFQKVVYDKVHELSSNTKNLFIVGVSKEELWDEYLNSFPEEIRQEYNCRYCFAFIRDMGAMVAINEDLTLTTIWSKSAKMDPVFNNVAEKMNAFVLSKAVVDIALFQTGTIGTKSNTAVLPLTGAKVVWNHFFAQRPACTVLPGSKSIDTYSAEATASVQVFKRCMEEIQVDALETMLELIAQNTLYRGSEFKAVISDTLKFKKQYLSLNDAQKNNFCWKNALQAKHVAHFRSSAIGTLAIDLSEGVYDLDTALTRYEKVTAPTNYKRPKGVFTEKQVNAAMETVTALGLMNALGRKHATVDDVKVENVLFMNDDVNKVLNNVFDDLKENVQVSAKSLDKVEVISLSDFREKILPTAKSVEILFEAKHEANLVSLIAPADYSAPSLFKWDNGFSWSYNNAIADSMRERVVALGGRVDGVFRFTHSWNHTGQNQSLMDLHVFFPTHKGQTNRGFTNKEVHNEYGNYERVGWNNRTHTGTKGNQDVDYTAAPGTSVPLENITFPDIKLLPEGDYICRIHNWSARSPNKTGYKAEVEFGGQIFQFERSEPLSNHEWVTVAVVNLKGGVFTLKSGGEAKPVVKTVWGMQTNTFHKVNIITKSPNYWGDNKSGNEHLFFFAEGFKNDGEVRGFFNEFLRDDLAVNHKQVFEALGGKMKVAPADRQLSGLGFSTTQSNEITLRVTGKFTRIIKVKI